MGRHSFVVVLWCLLGVMLSLPPVARAAEPLVPLCDVDDATCEVTLEAAYRFTMIWPQYSPQGSRWIPVGAKEDGLYTVSGDLGCGGADQKLTDEEAATVIIGDGSHRVTFAVNDSVPGPPIVVYKGQELIINFHNNLENEAATLHLHGFHQRGTPWMDGAGQVSQCPIPPGGKYTYRTTADLTGTFWYHAHLGAEYSMGLHGPIVVLPRNKEEENKERGEDPLPDFEAQYSLVIQDWMDLSSPELNVIASFGGSRYGNFKSECEPPTFQPDGALVSQWPFYSAIINGKGRVFKQHTDVAENPYVPLETFSVKAGKKYYFRVISSALTFPFSISIDGHPLHVVAADGRPIVTEVMDSVILSTGERYDFWIEAKDPEKVGNYWIRADVIEATNQTGDRIRPNHVNAILNYEGYPKQDPTTSQRECTAEDKCQSLNCPYRLMPDDMHTECTTLQEMRATVPDHSAWEDKDVLEFFLDLQINPVWSVGNHPIMNGIKNVFPSYPAQVFPEQYDNLKIQCDPTLCHDNETACECTYLLKIPLNKTVHIIMMTEPDEDDPAVNPHPMHIHGYTPQVVKIGWPEYDPVTQTLKHGNKDIKCNSPLCNDGAHWTNASWAHGNLPGMSGPYSPRKDTVFVPTGGYIVWRFKADNPGFWLMHCHIEFHGLDGMTLLVQVGEPEDMPPAPARLPRCGDFRITEEEYHAAVNWKRGQKSEESKLGEDGAPVMSEDPAQAEMIPGGLMLCSFQIATVVLAVTCVILVVLLNKKNAAARGYNPVVYVDDGHCNPAAYKGCDLSTDKWAYTPLPQKSEH